MGVDLFYLFIYLFYFTPPILLTLSACPFVFIFKSSSIKKKILNSIKKLNLMSLVDIINNILVSDGGGGGCRCKKKLTS